MQDQMHFEEKNCFQRKTCSKTANLQGPIIESDQMTYKIPQNSAIKESLSNLLRSRTAKEDGIRRKAGFRQSTERHVYGLKYG